jgi:DNA-binding transcriptional ArsR family regulator
LSPSDLVFDAIADGTRRSILDLLRDEPVLTAGELAAAFPAISRPAVSKHLRVLREAGLVTAAAVGRELHYRLQVGPLADAHREWFAAFVPLWDQTLRQLKARAEGR